MYESYPDPRENAGMGVIPIALPAIGSVVSAVSSLFNSHPKDKGRLETNLQLFNAAISGDAAALEELRKKAAGGWATQVAKDDAKQKYASALAILGANAPAAPGTSKPSTAQAGFSIPPLVLAGAAAIGVALLMRRRR